MKKLALAFTFFANSRNKSENWVNPYKPNQGKSTLLLLLLLTITGLAKAQTHEFAPVGAEWHYTRFYRIGPSPDGITYDRFRSLRTVEINGWICKEIELFQNLDCTGEVNPHTETRYIAQEDDRVYEVENGQRFLLYDFGKEAGDWWYAPKYDDTIKVLNISYITLDDGSVRKVLETQPSNYDWYVYNIIEGIGMDYSLFPFDETIMGTPCVHGPIRCYSENGFSLIVSDTECDHEVLAVDERDNLPAMAITTLVENTLQMDFSEMPVGMKQIRIVDMAGKIVFEHETTDKTLVINFADKPAGLYLVQTIIGSQVINNKIIKQ